MTTVTQWFVSDEKPAHVGLYEKGTYQFIDDKLVGGLYAYWNGRYWGVLSSRIDEALKEKNAVSVFQNDPWRGLSEKPA